MYELHKNNAQNTVDAGRRQFKKIHKKLRNHGKKKKK
jgi:hypothetical protein